VAEWFKAPVLKTGVPARVPWVRIPPLPPFVIDVTILLPFYALLPHCVPKSGNFRIMLTGVRLIAGFVESFATACLTVDARRPRGI
jgi:hypothetical protein